MDLEYKKMPSFQRVCIGGQFHDFAYQRLKAFLRQKMKNAPRAIREEEILKWFLGSGNTAPSQRDAKAH